MKKFILLNILLLSIVFVSAQKMTIGYVYPAGGQKGTTFEIEIGGLNIKEATSVLISGDGVKAVTIANPVIEDKKAKFKKSKTKFDDQSSPQLADRITVKVEIDKNAAPGFRDLRLQSVKGVSNKLIFEVGQYQNLVEKKGSTIQNPNITEQLPVTFCGQIMPGEKDYFSFKAEKGMTLVAVVKARVLVPYIADAVPGWFQSVIQILNSKGKEIGYNDDYRNSVDPVLITKIPENDTYTLVIYDAIFRGREDFDYRIDVGEIPYLNYIYPCVGKIKTNSSINLVGVNLKESVMNFKPNTTGEVELRASGKSGQLSNSVPFLSLSNQNQLELKSSANPNLITGKVIYDSISSSQKIKSYKINAGENENLVFQVTARKLESLLDARLRLFDSSGKLVSESDDVEDGTQGLMTFHADPLLKYTTKQAGTYRLEIEDVLGESGKEYFYVLESKTNVPTFELFVSPANISIPKGGTANFKVDFVSQEKIIPAMDLNIKGLPGGCRVSNLRTTQNVKSMEVSITSPENVKSGKYDLQVSAQTRNKKNDQQTTVNQTAVPADNMTQAFFYEHHIPATAFEAEITQEAPFSLHFEKVIENDLEEPLEFSIADTIIQLKVLIKRKPGFNETIELALNRKNKQIVLDPIKVLPDEKEKVLNLKIDMNGEKNKKRIIRQIAIVGTVNGEVDKKGKRTFENAKYREISPLILLNLK